MNIEITSNFGRLATRASTVIGDDVNPATVELCEEGLQNILFRAGGSAGFKALVDAGICDKKTPRAEIPYSVETGKLLAKAMNDAVNGEKSKLPLILFEVTGEYVFGDSATVTKEAEALFMLLVNGVMIDGKLTGGLGEAGAITKLKVESREEAVMVCKVRLQEEKKLAAAAALAKLQATFAAMEA